MMGKEMNVRSLLQEGRSLLEKHKSLQVSEQPQLLRNHISQLKNCRQNFGKMYEHSVDELPNLYFDILFALVESLMLDEKYAMVAFQLRMVRKGCGMR